MTHPLPTDPAPLPTARFQGALALAAGDKHGYAIMREVKALTDGAVAMGPGTLYGAIKRMTRAGLVEETEERPAPELDDERRRYYRLTARDSRALDAEVARMERLAGAARLRQGIGQGGRMEEVS